MNEVDFGAPWPVSFAAIVRAKLSRVSVVRKFALEGHRFTPREALEADLVDEVVVGGTTTGVLERAREIAREKAPKAREGVWGLIKTELYRPVLELVRLEIATINVAGDESAAQVRLAKL